MDKAQKEALLLVTFGSTYERPQASFRNIEKNIRKSFPEHHFAWAYTSNIVRRRMLKRGIELDAPVDAIDKLYAAGYRSIAVQSLHIIPGLEYEKVTAMAASSMERYPDLQIRLGAPLLQSDEDMQLLASILYQRFEAELKAGEAVLFMGHGSAHSANDRYHRIDSSMKQLNPQLYVAAVEGSPSLDDLLEELKQSPCKRLNLMALMSVAGDHAANDMAGDDEDSWKSQLVAAGYEVKIDMTALGDLDEVCQIWVQHLQDAQPWS